MMLDWRWLPVLVLLMLIVRRFFVCISLIRGRSMLSTLRNNDVALVSRLHYLLVKPKRGDIVICFYPGRQMKHCRWLRQPMVKRVIALPGETIEIVEGQTMIDGQPLEESYLDPNHNKFRRSMAPIVLGTNQYFVMGDNRDGSHDSRRVGPLERSMLTGQVLLLLWPPRRWGRVR